MKQPIDFYATREQQLAKRHNTASSYLGLDNGLCRAFLQCNAYPPEFESVKLLFPFIREAALIQLPRKQIHLADWMFFAFHAGNNLGACHPELLPEVLPDLILREAWRRLGVLQKVSGREFGYGHVLYEAFERIVQDQWPDTPPARLDVVYAESALRALRAGFAVATTAHLDARFCDFYGPVSPDARSNFSRILWRHLLGAPADAVGRSVLDQLEHPVLRIVRQLYPARPTECATVQNFLREHLRECGVRGENECPASDAELIDWIATGIDYGRRIQREQPETVQQIFAEAGDKALNGAIEVAQETVAEVGSIEPTILLPAIKRWQKDVYGSNEPSFYGERIERVALFADFAVWVPWGLSQPTRSQTTSNSQGSQISLGA